MEIPFLTSTRGIRGEWVCFATETHTGVGSGSPVEQGGAAHLHALGNVIRVERQKSCPDEPKETRSFC